MPENIYDELTTFELRDHLFRRPGPTPFTVPDLIAALASALRRIEALEGRIDDLEGDTAWTLTAAVKEGGGL